MHIHILGICGTFMGGFALLARAAGHTVSGCDANVYPPMSTMLDEQGIAVIAGYDAAQLHNPVVAGADMFVIGNALSRGNPLIEAILNAGKPYTSAPQWLGEHVLQSRWVLAVAGTHGKTTTTAILTWMLEHAGMNPGFLVGGVPNNFGVSARLGESFFVIEADEYDTAFFDKRSKFVHYRPKTAILNNLEYDHADIFPDLTAIETQFHHLVRTVPALGCVIANDTAVGGKAALDRVLARGAWCEVQRFGEDTNESKVSPAASASSASSAANNSWQIGQIFEDGSYEVWFQGTLQGLVHSDLTGAHNRANVLAAIAAARHVGIAPAVSIAAMRTFQSVKRRMEIKGCVQGITVYDDFAHHPTAIATTLAGLRAKIHRTDGVNTGRVLAVFEPRSNTMKLGSMKDALAESLRDADFVFGYGETSQNSSKNTQNKNALDWDLGAVLAPLGDRAVAYSDLAELVSVIVNIAQAGDHIVVMSNGSFGGVHEKLLAGLNLKLEKNL